MVDAKELSELYSLLEREAAYNLGIHEDDVWTPKELGISIRKVTDQGFDHFTVIASRKGFGKSSLAHQLAVWQLGGPGNSDYTAFGLDIIQNNFVYANTAKGIYERLKFLFEHLPRYHPVVVDEGKKFHSRDFMSGVNKMLVKWLGENRKIRNPDTGEFVGNKHLIFCLEDFLSLDRGIRATANLHIELLARGIGAIFRPLPIINRDKWMIDYLHKLEFEEMKKQDVSSSDLLFIKRQIQIYRKLPTFDGIIVFPNMDLKTGEVKEEDIGPIEKAYLEFDGQAKNEETKDEKEKEQAKTAKKPSPSDPPVITRQEFRMVGKRNMLVYQIWKGHEAEGYNRNKFCQKFGIQRTILDDIIIWAENDKKRANQIKGNGNTIDPDSSLERTAV